ncbi:hypothetical protein D3C76_1777010 [compost metagenome]
MAGIRVVVDQLKVLQALLGLGQQDLRIQQKLLQRAAVQRGAIHHEAPACEAEVGLGHTKSIACKSLTPFMQ